jgi:acyl carrier protein
MPSRAGLEETYRQMIAKLKNSSDVLAIFPQFHASQLPKIYRNEKEIRTMFEKMKELIAANLNVETGEITEDTSFGEDLGADSLDLMELVMAFEEEYDVEIPAEDMESLTTVGAVMEYLKGKGVEE